MGTRADFYIGRGKNAQWLGSIAFDGYPDGNPRPLLNVVIEQKYREQVAAILDDAKSGATKPEHGWPWPWKDSNTTDFAYAFDEGSVWGTCFGHGWWPFEKWEETKDNNLPKITDWPQMDTDCAARAGSDRSGVMVITAPSR